MSIPVRSPLDLGLNQLLSAVVENLAADPGTVTEGRIFAHTGQHVFKVGLNGAWVSFLVSTTRLDQLASPTGPVTFNGQKATGLADGTIATDAATVGQLNNVVAGLDIKPSARAATTGNVALTGTQTVDGVALVAGDRVLVRAQTAPAENGVYVVAAGAWPRATDMDAWTEIPGSIVAVELGTANADTVWLFTADQGGTLGTTAITTTKIAPAAASGGTGTVVKSAVTITGNGTLTTLPAVHNLASTDIQVQVWDIATGQEVFVEKDTADANTVNIIFAVAPVNGKTYRVITMA